MNSLKYYAILMSALAMGCSEKTETVSSTPSRPASPALERMQEKAAFSSALPAACQSYLDRVAACASSQTGAVANAIRAGAEQSRVEWAEGKFAAEEMAQMCEASLKAFYSQAAALKC